MSSNKPLFTAIKQGRGLDLAHMAGGLTLEAQELEKGCNPSTHLPQTSGPTFTSSELTPLPSAPGPHPVKQRNSASVCFPETKGHLLQQEANFFHRNTALNFKKIKASKNKIFIIIYNYSFRNMSSILSMHILHKHHLLLMN